MMLRTLAAVAASALLAAAAEAQIERAGPFMQRSEPKDWLVRIHVALTPATEVQESTDRRAPSMTEAQSDDVTVSPRFDIEQATVFWPVCHRSASYEVDRESLTGEVTLSGEQGTRSPKPNAGGSSPSTPAIGQIKQT